MGQTQSGSAEDKPQDASLAFEGSDSLLIERQTFMREEEPEDPTLRHAHFELAHGAREVYIAGSCWSNWEQRIAMERKEGRFHLFTKLPKGRHLYKYIADGQWLCDPEQPQQWDNNGNCNNVINLHDSDGENSPHSRQRLPSSTSELDEGARSATQINDIKRILKKLSYCEPPKLPEILRYPRYFQKVEQQQAYLAECVQKGRQREHEDIQLIDIYYNTANQNLPFSVHLSAKKLSPRRQR